MMRNAFRKLTLVPMIGASTLVVGFVSTAHVQAAEAYGLQAIYQKAVSFDAKLAQAKAEFESESQASSTAMGALLPQIQAEGNYFITDSNNDLVDNHSQSLSLTLNQSIYQHDQWARFHQAQYVVEAAQYRYQLAQQDLILRVSEAYFDVLLAQKNLSLAKDKYDADLTQFDTANAAFELGLASQVDVQEAKSNLDLSKADIISAENQLDITFETLANISGMQVTVLKNEGLKALLADVALPSEAFQIHNILREVEVQNLSVKVATTQLNQATEEVAVKRSGHLPSISFQAQYTDQEYSEFQAGSTFTDSEMRSESRPFSIYAGSTFTDSETTRYGINVTMPLFSGGSVNSEVTAAKKQTLSAQEALRDAKQSATLEARTLIRSIEQGHKLIAALREAVKSNNAFVKSAQEGFKVGMRSMLEVLTAISNQTSAQRDLTEAIHNQVLNRLRLEATLGVLDVDDIAKYETLLQVEN